NKEECRRKNGANGMSDIEGKAARVAASECGQRASFKRIYATGRRPSRFALCARFPRSPKTTEAQVLGKQLLRSGTSIGANYREAFRARSKAAFIAKCGDSLREIEEWSVLGNRDIDGSTREVAVELL